jgi:hypothetical protein
MMPMVVIVVMMMAVVLLVGGGGMGGRGEREGERVEVKNNSRGVVTNIFFYAVEICIDLSSVLFLSSELLFFLLGR